MVTRLAMVILILPAAGSACAESLTPDAARRFVAGKLFAFNCFDGSRGAACLGTPAAGLRIDAHRDGRERRNAGLAWPLSGSPGRPPAGGA